jgi:hypothetical protein
MDSFYACSGKHVKEKNENSCCLCLLGHAKVHSAMGKINKAAQMLSKLGASKGGKARAKKLTPEQRKAIAQKAAKARWGEPKQE